MNAGRKEFEEESLCSKNAVPLKVLEKPMGCQMKPEKNKNRTYVDGTVMHLARLDAWTKCVVTTMITEVRRSRRRQTFSTALYGR